MFMVVLLFVLVSIVAFVAAYWKKPEPTPRRPLTPELIAALGTFQEKGVATAFNEDNSINYGLYSLPIQHPNFKVTFRLKEWHFHTISTPDYFIGFALVNCQYLSQAWCYLVDKRENNVKYEFESTLPLTQLQLAVGKFEKSSVEGRTAFSFEGNHLHVAYVTDDEFQGAWHVKIDLQLTEHITKQTKRLKGELTLAKPNKVDDELALLYPLEPDRPAYTHKTPLLVTRGELKLERQEKSFQLIGSPGTLDFTRSYEMRVTTWKWASFSFFSKNGKHVTVNLTNVERFGDRENVVWVEGRLYLVGPVEFISSSSNGMWNRIRSSNSNNSTAHIDLVFTASVSKDVDLNVLVIRSDFTQAVGTFSGTVKLENQTLVVEKAWGVGERHYALW